MGRWKGCHISAPIVGDTPDQLGYPTPARLDKNGKPTKSHLYQRSLILTHRDALPRLSARSVRRSDVGHRKTCATLSESLGKAPFRSCRRTAGGRRKALTMSRIACGFPPTRRIACAISMGQYQGPLVYDRHLFIRWPPFPPETRHVMETPQL